MAVLFETEFRELYARCGDAPVPNCERTEVCFRLLDELVARLGASPELEGIGRSLRDELFVATFTEDNTRTLVPYFDLVAGAQEENSDLAASDTRARRELRATKQLLQQHMEESGELNAARKRARELAQVLADRDALIEDLRDQATAARAETKHYREQLEEAKAAAGPSARDAQDDGGGGGCGGGGGGAKQATLPDLVLEELARTSEQLSVANAELVSMHEEVSRLNRLVYSLGGRP